MTRCSHIVQFEMGAVASTGDGRYYTSEEFAYQPQTQQNRSGRLSRCRIEGVGRR
jgi:hypothetical protein